MDEEDRISQLPLHILHHKILSLLPQKDAVQTCILSKSWRYLGPTRPKIEFHQSNWDSKAKFLSVIENTLQRYVEKNLSAQEFVLSIWHDSESNKSCSLLNKWIVKLHMLNRLSLKNVYIEDQTFEKIMSRCPSIQYLVLESCQGLSSVKVNKARNLKHFCCHEIDSIEINDDAPSLETISVSNCLNWYLNKNNDSNNFFPRLKSLYLWNVHLTTELFDNLSSNNCPCLEKLRILFCSGFTEFKLSNRSIKRLIINTSDLNPIEVAIIDAANMLYFEFVSRCYVPSVASFATTSREWTSHIKVNRPFSPAHVSSSTRSLKLHEFLKALSQSQISLDISYLPELMYQDTNNDGGGSCEPVVVEHLCLTEYYPSSQLRLFLNCVFRICRPRYVGLFLNYHNSQKIHESQLADSIWETLVNKGETTKCNFWQQDLEESSIQVSDENTNEWHPVQVCAFSNNQSIRFRLKWKRDFS